MSCNSSQVCNESFGVELLRSRGPLDNSPTQGDIKAPATKLGYFVRNIKQEKVYRKSKEKNWF